MTIDPQAVLAVVAFFAIVILLQICFSFVPYILDEERFERAMWLLEPRWKREAHFLAKNIPAGRF